MKNYKSESGFSLVEMAIVMAILGVVFAGYMVGFGSFYHSANLKESKAHEVNIKKQILKFGEINGYLPCPDTDGDGKEDRNGALCKKTYGEVPYLDIGLKVSDVEDGWGNPIRYAVNTDTKDPALICDKRSSASMFCNQGAATNTPWFDLDTPPTAEKLGTGNYVVCNKTASSCSTSVAASKLETDTAVVVLVAYNEDGAKTIASMPGCGGIPSQNVDNCNTDNVYHQREISVDEDNFFDDVVTTISGYEVKASLISKTISWNSFESSAPPPYSLEATYTNFDISSQEYKTDKKQIETKDDDVILVNRNVSESLDLGKGNDYIAIGNNLESGAVLNTGDGDDSVYIVNLMQSAVNLGDGNDKFVLGTNLTTNLNAGNGNDKVWIQGNINRGSDLNLGSGDDVLWVGNTDDLASGNIYRYIDGGAGTDILVLENVKSMADFRLKTTPLIQSLFPDNFEYIVFADDGTGHRDYCTYTVDCFK